MSYLKQFVNAGQQEGCYIGGENSERATPCGCFMKYSKRFYFSFPRTFLTIKMPKTWQHFTIIIENNNYTSNNSTNLLNYTMFCISPNSTSKLIATTTIMTTINIHKSALQWISQTRHLQPMQWFFIKTSTCVAMVTAWHLFCHTSDQRRRTLVGRCLTFLLTGTR